jgi:acetylornithine deacetylase
MPRPAQATIDMLRRLVGFDTTSRLSNLALIDWVRAYLARYGIECTAVYDATGTKANLWATIGPKDRGGIVLSGHTDVVPVDGQEWTSAPFELLERDGRLYGRGTCDMKSFLAVALALVPEFVRLDLKTPLHFCLSYDEEVGCIGVRRLIAELGRIGARPKACIVGEPSSMVPVRAHKGKISYRCKLRGFEAHSSLAPKGVNAVEYAALLVARIAAMGRDFARNGPFDPEFDIPHTTAHTGTIRGGTALNIVPKDCQFDFEFRHLPDSAPEPMFAAVRDYAERELVPAMRAVHADTGIVFEPLSTIPPCEIADAAPIVALAKQATGRNAAAGKVAYGTEAGLFQNADIPTVVCGPGHIDQAHKPDEFVALDQLAQCESFLRRVAERAVAGW